MKKKLPSIQTLQRVWVHLLWETPALHTRPKLPKPPPPPSQEQNPPPQIKISPNADAVAAIKEVEATMAVEEGISTKISTKGLHPLEEGDEEEEEEGEIPKEEASMQRIWPVHWPLSLNNCSLQTIGLHMLYYYCFIMQSILNKTILSLYYMNKWI